MGINESDNHDQSCQGKIVSGNESLQEQYMNGTPFS